MIRATEDKSKGISFVQNFAASWIPNIVRSGARAFDPYFRDQKLRQRDDRSTIAELAANIGQAAIPAPGLQDAPRMDYWGRPLAKTESLPYGTDILWRLVSPIQIQTATIPDNFDRMLHNFNRRAKENGWETYWPEEPSNAFTLPGQPGTERTGRMNPDERSIFLERRGEYFRELAKGQRWNFDKPGLEDIRQMKRLMNKAGELAKRDIIKTHDAPPTWRQYQDAKRRNPTPEDRAMAMEIFKDRDADMARQVMGR